MDSMPNIYKTESMRRELILKVTPNRGNHPKGEYIIPNRVIVSYIETKREAYNWQKNKTFHQDGIPRDLKYYFNEIN